MYKHLLFIFLLITFSFQLRAQEAARLLSQFSFSKYLGGIVLLQAKLEPYSDTLNFILDTGSSGVSLDSLSAAGLGVESRLTDTFSSGIGGKRKVRFTFNRTLDFQGFKVDSLNIHINNYGLLSAIYNVRIDGIIGYSFLKRFIVTIDYEKKIMQVYSKGKMNYPEDGYVFNAPINAIPSEDITIKDSREWEGKFYFDSGAGLELLFSKQFVTDSNILLPKRKPLFIGVEGMLGREKMKVTVVKSFQLGPYKFKNVPTYIFDDTYNVLRYPQNMGLVGSGIFSRFNLILNYAENEIFIKPNKYFNDAFEYAYSGLSIWERNGKIEVFDIIPGSPAEKAAFAIGDEIMSVDNSFSFDIDIIRKALRCKNCGLEVFIKRDGALKKLHLRTTSIL